MHLSKAPCVCPQSPSIAFIYLEIFAISLPTILGSSRSLSTMTNINDQSSQVQIYTVTAILLAIATVGVALRLLARRISSARFWWDDYTIIVALVISTPSGLALFALPRGEKKKANKSNRYFIMDSQSRTGFRRPSVVADSTLLRLADLLTDPRKKASSR